MGIKQFLLGAALAAMLSIAFASDDTPILKAPRDGLVDVPLLKTDALEEVVGRQVRSFQKALENILNANHSDPEVLGRAYGLLGQVYLAYSWHAPARRCFLNAAALDQEAFPWQYLLGMVEIEMGNTDEGEACFQRAAALRPDYLATYIRLGDIRLQFHDALGALEHYQHVLNADDTASAAWLGVGQARYILKEYEASLAAYQKSATLTPSATKVNYFMAMTYRAMGQEETARAYLARAGKVGVKPKDALMEDIDNMQRGERVYMQKGQAAFSAGQYPDAAKMYELALKSNPESIPARVNLASCLALIGRLDEAVAQFQAALVQKPDNFTAHYNLGRIFAGQGKLNEAESHLTQAVALNPDDLELQLNLAKLLGAKGKHTEAVALFEQLEKKAPDTSSIPVAKLTFYLENKAYDLALDLLPAYRKKFPTDAQLAHFEVQLLVGHPKFSRRDGQRALTIALQLLESQKSPVNFENVAMAHAELGRCDRAARWQEQAVELYSKAQLKEAQALAEKQLQLYQSQKECRIPGQ